MPFSIFLGLALTTAACMCIYAASPHQKMFASPWPALVARGGSGALLLAGWLGFSSGLHRLTASLVTLTAVMLVLAVLPYVGVWVHGRRSH
ncbi:hypothetical protein [Comamonas sp. NoAH]|uniref:hypothetical protein n=1 Tax=Comamonas halotolerans TaxID=3041496 RepID=UPI0024E10AB7|nr:hypothetical protein [Comamonas sp. NoAH]